MALLWEIGCETLQKAPRQIHADLWAWIWILVVMSACYGGLYVLAKRLLLSGVVVRSTAPANLADMLFNIPFLPLLSWLAVMSFKEMDYFSTEGRWWACSPTAKWVLLLYGTKTLVRTINMRICAVEFEPGQKARDKVLMMAHHILSLIPFVHGYTSERMHFFASLDILCEISSIFLNNLHLWRTFGICKDRGILGVLYITNGIMLWTTFVIFRLVVFSVWIYVFVTDVQGNPANTWDRVNIIERYLYLFANIFLLGVSSYWFVFISRGLSKYLTP